VLNLIALVAEAAVAAKFSVHYRSAVSLDRRVNGTFSASLTRVLSRLLDGYDRVVRHGPEGLDVVILGVSPRSSPKGEPSSAGSGSAVAFAEFAPDLG